MFVGLGELQFQDVFCIRHLHRKLEEYLSEHSLGTQPAETAASCLTVLQEIQSQRRRGGGHFHGYL